MARRGKAKKTVALRIQECHSRVMAVDPGRRCSYCVAQRVGDKWEVAAVESMTTDAHAIMALLRSWQPDVVSVEDQFLGVSAQGTIALVRYAHTWTALAQALDLETRMLHPSTWGAAVGCHGMTTAQRKVHTRAWCEERGIHVVSHDQADAVVMCSVLVGSELTEGRE